MSGYSEARMWSAFACSWDTMSGLCDWFERNMPAMRPEIQQIAEDTVTVRVDILTGPYRIGDPRVESMLVETVGIAIDIQAHRLLYLGNILLGVRRALSPFLAERIRFLENQHNIVGGRLLAHMVNHEYGCGLIYRPTRSLVAGGV